MSNRGDVLSFLSKNPNLFSKNQTIIFFSKLIKFIWNSKVAMYVPVLNALVGEKVGDIPFIFAVSNGAFHAPVFIFWLVRG